LIKTVRPNNTVQNRTYDAAGQLTNLADLASDGSTIVQYTYTYDAAGKLTNEARSPVAPSYSPGAPATLAYDSDSQLTTYAGQPVSYNLNGDALTTPLNGTLSPLTYDARDRLAAAGGITYAYDAENRRIQSTSLAGATTFVVNPNAPFSQLLVSVAPSGSTTRNVYGLGLIYQDTDGTTVRYLHSDFRGSTVALTEAAGIVTGRIEYGPFGEISSQSGDTTTSFQYVGQAGVETDANGLNYMRARHYNPQIRRFLQQDSWLGGISDPETANRYLYALDNPTLNTDPSGFSSPPPGGSLTLEGLNNLYQKPLLGPAPWLPSGRAVMYTASFGGSCLFGVTNPAPWAASEGIALLAPSVAAFLLANAETGSVTFGVIADSAVECIFGREGKPSAPDFGAPIIFGGIPASGYAPPFIPPAASTAPPDSNPVYHPLPGRGPPYLTEGPPDQTNAK
jgi:RHS repeat-associated protein